MLNERKLTERELDKRAEAIQGLLSNKRTLVKKYGKEAEKVMYGIATKQAKSKVEGMNKDKIKELIQQALVGEQGPATNTEPYHDQQSTVDTGFSGRADYGEEDKALGQEDELEMKGLEEDLDIGHQDDEPGMLKKELARAGQMIQMLYRAVDKYDDQGEVDFPQWWQAKIIKANAMLDSAFDYLDGEEMVAKIDAMIDSADEIEVDIDVVNEEEVKKRIEAEKAIKQTLKDEGGAAGLEPLVKAVKKFGFNKEELIKLLKKVVKVEKHKHGDYILVPLDERVSFDDILDLRSDKKDLEDRIAQLYRDMEQEAEPEGGEVADRYGSELDKLEDKLYKVMSKINDYDMNESTITESKGAKLYFDDLKYYYTKTLRYLDKDEVGEYKQLAKNYFSKLQEDKELDDYNSEFKDDEEAQERMDNEDYPGKIKEGTDNEKEIKGQELVDYIMSNWNWSEEKTLNWLADNYGKGKQDDGPKEKSQDYIDYLKRSGRDKEADKLQKNLKEETFEDEIGRLKDIMYVEQLSDGRFFIHPLDKPGVRRPSRDYIVIDGNNVVSIQGHDSGPIQDLADRYNLEAGTSQLTPMGKINAQGRISLLSSNILKDAIKAIKDSRDVESKRQSDYYKDRGPVSGIGSMDEMIKSIVKEKLTKSSSVEDHIDDFKDSDAKQFKGKSLDKIKKMALASFLSKQKK